ncbi:Rha family transcriptional regulator [Amorphus coralli]|uniref:Rha family transcriptional regulator n=1 Tax=Amorphus coralli TaxID=340680 RepID=UPI000371C49B|nr:Rha family transcriptional regulator [Amorphus coralli]
MLIPAQQPLTMSSREIAELCETRHNQVVETIRRLMAAGVLRESRKTTRRVQPEGGGRPMDVYDLTKRDTLVVVSGYRDDLRARIIDRWMELESRPAVDLDNPAQLRALLLDYSDKMIALEADLQAALPKVEAYEH